MKEKVHYLWEFLLIGFLLLNTTCRDKDEINKVFPVEKQLTAKEIPIEEIIDLERSTFVIVGDFFVFASPRTDTVIFIYSLPDFHFVKCFGIKGQGPNDFLEPEIVNSNTTDLYLFGNSNSELLKKFDIHASDENKLVIKEYKLSGIPYGIRNLTVINDSILFYFDDIPMKIGLKSFDLKLGKMINSREIKVEERHQHENEYRNIGTLSANEHTLSYSYLYQNRIDFMYHDFSIKKIIKGDKQSIRINPSDIRDSKFFYTAYYAGKEKTYFLYWGFSPNKSENNKQYIEVYDREGNPLIKYKLDITIYRFTVDEKTNRIYGLSEAEDSIFMFDLN
jgi:hypothetical protein